MGLVEKAQRLNHGHLPPVSMTALGESRRTTKRVQKRRGTLVVPEMTTIEEQVDTFAESEGYQRFFKHLS